MKPISTQGEVPLQKPCTPSIRYVCLTQSINPPNLYACILVFTLSSGYAASVLSKLLELAAISVLYLFVHFFALSFLSVHSETCRAVARGGAAVAVDAGCWDGCSSA